MKYALIGVLFFLPATAFAAEAPKAAPPPAAYTITLKSADLATIGKALENLPFKDAAPILNELQKQVTDQTKALSDIKK